MGSLEKGELLLVASRSRLALADGPPLQRAAARQAHLDQEIFSALSGSIAFYRIHLDAGTRWRAVASKQIGFARRERPLGGATRPADAAHAKFGQHLRQSEVLLVRSHLTRDKA